jgi:hypothetical protein
MLNSNSGNSDPNKTANNLDTMRSTEASTTVKAVKLITGMELVGKVDDSYENYDLIRLVNVITLTAMPGPSGGISVGHVPVMRLADINPGPVLSDLTIHKYVVLGDPYPVSKSVEEMYYQITTGLVLGYAAPGAGLSKPGF